MIDRRFPHIPAITIAPLAVVRYSGDLDTGVREAIVHKTEGIRYGANLIVWNVLDAIPTVTRNGFMGSIATEQILGATAPLNVGDVEERMLRITGNYRLVSELIADAINQPKIVLPARQLPL